MDLFRICIILFIMGLMTSCGTGHSKGMLLLNKKDDVEKYNSTDGVLAFIPLSEDDYSWTVSLMNYDDGKVYSMPLEGTSLSDEFSIAIPRADVIWNSGADSSFLGRRLVLYSLPKGRYELLRVSVEGERNAGFPQNGAKQGRFKTNSDTILIEPAHITDLGVLRLDIKENFFGSPNDVEIKTIGNIKNSSFGAIQDDKISVLPVSHVTFAAEKMKKEKK